VRLARNLLKEVVLIQQRLLDGVLADLAAAHGTQRVRVTDIFLSTDINSLPISSPLRAVKRVLDDARMLLDNQMAMVFDREIDRLELLRDVYRTHIKKCSIMLDEKFYLHTVGARVKRSCESYSSQISHVWMAACSDGDGAGRKKQPLVVCRLAMLAYEFDR
jgi:hypothetical protein